MLSNVINYYKAKKKMVSLFLENSSFFEPGQYTFDKTMSYISLKDKKVIREAGKLLSGHYAIILFRRKNTLKKGLINPFLIFFFNIRLKINGRSNGNDIFKGCIFLPSMHITNFKIFDLTNELILSYFLNKADFKMNLESIKYFKRYFLVPKIISVDKCNQLIVEERIKHKNPFEWGEDDYSLVMTDMQKKYTLYLSSVGNMSEFSSKSPIEILRDLPVDNGLLNCIKDNISENIINQKFPILKMHGDLWKSNILIDDKKRIYYIDWGCSEELIFIYDIFVYLWQEAILYKNYTYLKKYFKGEYNEYIKGLFNIFGIEFKEEYLLDYLKVFLIFYFKEKWLMFSSSSYQFNLYKTIVQELASNIK